jgi:hypothetical protein
MLKALAVVAAIATPFVLGGCRQAVEAPAEPGVCYAVGAADSSAPKFNVVASHVPDMEHCAAALEGMRIRFLSLGGSQSEVTGAYQGNFLFLDETGVFTAANFDGGRYPFLVRTGDGHLVPPGAAQ